MIVHLNGWPGAGKKTIGAVLAAKLNAGFIENHLLHGVAIACAGYDGADRWGLYETVRSAAYEVLKQRPADEVFVMTNALCRDSAREQAAWRHVVDLAMARDVPLVPVVLELSRAENVRRLQSKDRVGRKLTDPGTLESYLAEDVLQKPAVGELLVIDVTTLSPDAAADLIVDHLRLLGGVSAASARHLEMQ